MLLSVPHAGCDYPDWLLDLSSFGRASLTSLEDPLVDRLAERAIAGGIGAVVAQAPRAAIDCNRAEEEVDPSVVLTGPIARITPRARGGLGIVPGRSATHNSLWRRLLAPRDLEDRLRQAHRPYHDAIARELKALRDRFGCALLIDCHSMPPPPGSVPPIVVGDRHGRSAARWLTAACLATVRSAGFQPSLNQPFAGGHIVARHGAPADGIHALQIEIDRRCYLAADGAEAWPAFGAVAQLIERLAVELGGQLLDSRYPAAAE